jgi:tryptophan synthase beta chain
MEFKMSTQSYKQPTAQGYYGQFGGAYIPEMLHPNVEELQQRYLEIMQDPAFVAEFNELPYAAVLCRKAE